MTLNRSSQRKSQNFPFCIGRRLNSTMARLCGSFCPKNPTYGVICAATPLNDLLRCPGTHPRASPRLLRKVISLDVTIRFRVGVLPKFYSRRLRWHLRHGEVPGPRTRHLCHAGRRVSENLSMLRRKVLGWLKCLDCTYGRLSISNQAHCVISRETEVSFTMERPHYPSRH